MQRSPFADTMIAHLESASKALKAGDYAKADELISAAQVVVGIDGELLLADTHEDAVRRLKSRGSIYLFGHPFMVNVKSHHYSSPEGVGATIELQQIGGRL